MEHSTGYQVANNHFPAIAINTEDVYRCLFRRAVDVVVQRTVAGGNPLRDGYRGMIITCGRVAPEADQNAAGASWSMRRG